MDINYGTNWNFQAILKTTSDGKALYISFTSKDLYIGALSVKKKVDIKKHGLEIIR